MFDDMRKVSANDRPARSPVAEKEIEGEAELRAFMDIGC